MKKLVLLFSLVLFAVIFVKAQVPVVNSFSPATGLVGSTVTISGSGFDGSSAANNQVFFGSAQAAVLTASFGTLTVTVPAGSTTNLISVRNVTSKLIGYSKSHFNGLFCSTPLTSTTYNSYNQQLRGIYGAYNIDIYDIDGDGKSDIITGKNDGGITIALNNSTIGTMNFAAYNIVTNAAVQQFFVADFDGDGKRDIVISGGNGAFLFPNLSTPGNISFGPRITIDATRPYYQCAAGDLNNDGKVDFIGGGNDNSAQLYTFRNTSTGPGNFSFAANTIIPSTNIGCLTRGLQSVDLDGDGKTDIVGTTFDCQTMYAIRNTTVAFSTTFSFATTQSFACPGNPYRLKLGDFDKDGKIDLVTPLYNSGKTGIFRNTSTIGNINFDALTTLPAVANNYRVGVGDVNGDGFPDIVTKPNGVGPVFQVYKNISTGAGNIAFDAPITYSSTAGAEIGGIAIGDLDGDLVPDIATSGTSSNVIRFHRNTSSQPDVIAPTAMCKNIIVALSTSGTVTVTAAMIDNGSADNCGLASLKINGQASLNYTCADVGPHTVTLTATDLAGNSATCTAVVTVSPAAIIVSGQTTVCQGQTILLTANTGDSYQWQKDGTNISGAKKQTYTATATGNYTVTVINTGCSGTSAAVNLTVNNSPTVLVTPNGTVYLCGSSNTAILTASSSSIYQWKLNSNNISGETQQSYTANASGSYTVQVTDAFGCLATSTPVVISANPPQINVQGKGNLIPNGDTTPSTTDDTDFGTIYPGGSVIKTYTIINSGLNPLIVSSINIGGSNAADFVLGAISLPVSIAAGGSATFTVTFSGVAQQIYNAEITVNNNDCNKSVYNFSLLAQVICQAPAITNCPFTGYSQIYTDPNSCSATFAYNLNMTGSPAPVISYLFSGATTGKGTGTGTGATFNVGQTTVTVTATNACGTATCSFVITVIDNILPIAICKPLTVYLGVNGTASIQPSDINNGSYDNCGPVTLSFNSGIVCGSAVENQNVNISAPAGTLINSIDFASYGTPNGTCGNFTIGGCHASNSISVVAPYLIGHNSGTIPAINSIFGDPCGGTVKRLYIQARYGATSAQSNVFNCSNIGSNSVSLLVSDANGNVSSCNAIVTVVDNQAPTITCPAAVTVQCASAVPAVNTASVSSSDNCSAIVSFVSDVISNQTCVNKYTITRTYKATDPSGNFATCTQIITVNDNTAPVITCPSNITVNNTTGQCGANVTFSASATDNCSGTPVITYSLASGSYFSVGITTVTATATDVCGNTSTCSFTVTVVDNQAPTIVCPVDISVNATSASGAVVTYTAPVGTDNCVSTTVRTAGLASGSTFPIGTTTVTHMVTDASGLTAQCSFTVTVTGILPQIVCPSNITVNNTTGQCGANVNFAATETVGIPASTITYSQNPGTFFPVGITTVTATATNAVGSSTCTFTVTVVDNQEPSIACAANQTQTADRDVCSTGVNVVSPVTGDNCAVATLTNNYNGTSNASGVYPVGTTTVIWTVTDIHGNTNTCSQTITVTDNEAPSIGCAANQTQTADAGVCSAAVTVVAPSTSDNCGVATVTNNYTNTANASGIYPKGTTSIIWTVTDIHGNTNTCTQTVTVTDNEAPLLSAPKAITLDCGASILPSNTGIATATDNCTTVGSIVIAYTDNHTVPVCGGTLTRTWSATDASNNQSTATQTITVSPAALPTMTAFPNITVACGGLPLASTISFSNGLTGGCLISGTSNPSTFTDTPSACGGTVTETWTAIDVCGRTVATVSRSITVSPAALPSMAAPEAVTISVPCGTSAVPSTLSFTNGLSSGCLISGTSNPSTFTAVAGTCGGTLTEKWTATDICGRALAPVYRLVTVSQNLGKVEPFVMFSGIGAVSNTGMSSVNGQVGSDQGAVSGFDPSTILFNSDAHTTQAKIDLLNLYIHLTNIPVTDATHAGVFGSNETLEAGVYTIPGAGSMAGNLNLDGKGNTNAIFILKTNGAFSPGASSSITLLNGLRACNVFWIAEGAISIGTASTMKGSFISHVGAVSMGAGGDLEGRLIATVGAVSFGPGVANMPVGLSTIPIICVNSCNSTILGSAAQFTLFTTAGAVSNTSTSGIIGNVGSNAGAVSGFGTSTTTLVGNTYNADGVTAHAAADLETGYATLVNMTATNSAHAAVFGGGETLNAGVYEIGSAGSMAGTLTLDGGGNADAQFIIKFGGAFSVGAQSKIILTNGTSHCNVFWLAEGAISIGASSYMKGSFIAHNGANTMGANGNLEGSLLSTAGAIGFNTGVGYISYSLCTNPGYIEYARANPVVIKKQNAILIDSKLSIFPNPSRGIVNLVTGDINKINSIEVVDVMGKLVYSTNHFEPTINLSNKAAGVYFIKVRLNSKITTTKIVVEK